MLSRSLLVFVLTALVTFVSITPLVADEILETKVGPVDVAILLPDQPRPLRGLYMHVAHYKLKSDDRWAESSRAIGFGHIALNINLKENSRPRKLGMALEQSLAVFAQKTGRKELPKLPIVGIGHSAGGMCTPVLLGIPKRMLTSCVSCGWIADPEKVAAADPNLPMVFTLGAIPDGFKMLPSIQQRFEPARAEGMPWCLGLQWGCAHDFGQSAALFIPWSEAIAELRLPDRSPATGELIPLRAVSLEDGWLGDRRTIDSTFAAVCPYTEFEGDKRHAVWLPNRKVAYVWRAIQSRNPPLALMAETADGKIRLSEYNPKESHQMYVASGAEIRLSATTAGDLKATRVLFFNGDEKIGDASETPFRCQWRPGPGAHTIFAQSETAAGNLDVSHPALIVVRHRR
jgi:hypothetical protein